MSIYALMRSDPTVSFQTRARRTPSSSGWERPLRARAGASTTGEGVAATLTKYVPSEVIALYTAVLPFLVSKTTPLIRQDFTGRWIVVGVISAIAVIYALGIYRQERRRAHEDMRRWVAIGRCMVVLVAFAAWVCVVPGSPFNAFSWYTPATGAAIGILTGGALAAVAFLFQP